MYFYGESFGEPILFLSTLSGEYGQHEIELEIAQVLFLNAIELRQRSQPRGPAFIVKSWQLTDVLSCPNKQANVTPVTPARAESRSVIDRDGKTRPRSNANNLLTTRPRGVPRANFVNNAFAPSFPLK
jgi:hypothetical protein